MSAVPLLELLGVQGERQREAEREAAHRAGIVVALEDGAVVANF